MARTKVDIYNHNKILEKSYVKRLLKFGKDKCNVESFLEQLTLEGLSSARLNKYIFTLLTIKRLREKESRFLILTEGIENVTAT